MIIIIISDLIQSLHAQIPFMNCFASKEISIYECIITFNFANASVAFSSPFGLQVWQMFQNDSQYAVPIPLFSYTQLFCQLLIALSSDSLTYAKHPMYVWCWGSFLLKFKISWKYSAMKICKLQKGVTTLPEPLLSKISGQQLFYFIYLVS